MKFFQVMNALLAFFLELLAIFIFGYWGATMQTGQLIQVFLAIALPVLIIGIWARWCAPASKHRLEGATLFLLKGAIFILVTICLVRVSNLLTTGIFAVLASIHLAGSAYLKKR